MTHLERLVARTKGPGSRGARLSESAEHELVARYQGGDRAAGDALVEAMLSLVVSIALEYRRWGASMDDVVQEGAMGLLAAVKRYHPARGARLATYAAYWIRAQIRDHVMRTYRTVRIGTTKEERRAVRHYRRSGDDDPGALAEASGLSIERSQRLLATLAFPESSLDAESSTGGGSRLDRLASPSPSPEEDYADREAAARAREAYEAALGELSAREQEILRDRVDRDEPLTLAEIGARLGVSKERVRQLEARACEKVRARMAELGVAA